LLRRGFAVSTGCGHGSRKFNAAGLQFTIAERKRGKKMASTIKAERELAAQELHAVPLTLEGSSVLHQMFRFRWPEWRKLSEKNQKEIVAEAGAALEKLEHHVNGQSALFSMLGHKADLMLIHFRSSFDHLKHAELEIARLKLND